MSTATGLTNSYVKAYGDSAITAMGVVTKILANGGEEVY